MRNKNWNFENENGDIYWLDILTSRFVGLNINKIINLNEFEVNYFKNKVVERYGKEYEEK